LIHDPEDSVQARAIQWHLKLRDADEATWEAFAAWLAQDPSHARVYDEVEHLDQTLEALLPGVEFRRDAAANRKPVRASLWGWPRVGYYGGALAASLAVLAVLAPRFLTDRYEVVTGPGQHLAVKLDATTEVSLNGSTRVTLDHRNARFAAVVSGEALFRVRHDSAKPFRVLVGENRIEDVGTVFDVVREVGEIRVSVAEGEVIYKARGQDVPLSAGQGVLDAAGSSGLRLTASPAASVGAWREGHLVYSGEPLSQVAADLARTLGVHIAVAPAIARRSFSGAIVLAGTGAAELNRLQPVLNVSLAESADGWTMTPIDHGAR
jgi:transmembrane sensor